MNRTADSERLAYQTADSSKLLSVPLELKALCDGSVKPSSVCSVLPNSQTMACPVTEQENPETQWEGWRNKKKPAEVERAVAVPRRLRRRRGADIIRFLLVVPDRLDLRVGVAQRRRQHLAVAALLSRSQVQ